MISNNFTLDEKSNLHKVCLVQTCCKYQPCQGLHPLRKWWVAKFAHFVQTWQPPLTQWVQTETKSMFATSLHKANFVQIRFFIQCQCLLRISLEVSFRIKF